MPAARRSAQARTKTLTPGAGFMAVILALATLGARGAPSGPTTTAAPAPEPEAPAAPLVLDQPTDYVLENVQRTALRDEAALTLSGRIDSVTLRHCRFGSIVAGFRDRAAGIEAAGARVGRFHAADCYLFDIENQLVSFRDGSFGTVTFERCTFRNSDAFLKQVYAASPWRSTPPVMEFYNIDRLELLDNEYANTRVVIHPSVKVVILRGAVGGLDIQSAQTRVIRLQRDRAIGEPNALALAKQACWLWSAFLQ